MFKVLISGESVVWWPYTVSPTPKTMLTPFVFLHKQPPLLSISLHSLQLRHNLLIYQNKRLQQVVTNTHLIRACLTAVSQCTMELCWHGPAWGTGRTEVYDCADVNDIIQILNQAARFQPSGSSTLAASLENLTWIPAVEQSNCCRQCWSGLPRLKMTGQICSGCQFVTSCLCVHRPICLLL